MRRPPPQKLGLLAAALFLATASRPSAVADDNPDAAFVAENLRGEWLFVADLGPQSELRLGEINLVAERGALIAAHIKTDPSFLGEFKAEGIELTQVKLGLTWNLALPFRRPEMECLTQAQEDSGKIELETHGTRLFGYLRLGDGQPTWRLSAAREGSPAWDSLLAKERSTWASFVGEPSLPEDRARPFLGEWKLPPQARYFLGAPCDSPATLRVGADAGMAFVEWSRPGPLGKMRWANLEVAEDGILTWEPRRAYDDCGASMRFSLRRRGPLLAGRLDIGDGMARMAFYGGRAGGGCSQVALADKTVFCETGRPSLSGPAHRAFAELKERELWPVGEGEPASFLSQADLLFDAKRLSTGYYSLFATRVGEERRLLVNPLGAALDEPRPDRVEIPLSREPLDESVDLFALSLETNGDCGAISFAWGRERWTAGFAAVQPIGIVPPARLP